MRAGADRRLVGAWFVAHRGRQVVVGSALASLLFAVFGQIRIQTWETGRWLPLWALAPGTLAIVAAVGLENQLGPIPAGRLSRPRVARLGWIAAVTATSTVAAVPVAVSLGDPAICVSTCLLVLAAFAMSAVSARSAFLVGLSVDAFSIVQSGRASVARAMGAVLGQLPWWLWAGYGIGATAGLVAYVVAGARSRPADSPY